MPTNYTPSQVYDKYVALQKQLATNITNKGVTASQTELYDSLIDKVAQIENLKGEERTLENFTNVLSEPKSIVQLEYPEPKNLFDVGTVDDYYVNPSTTVDFAISDNSLIGTVVSNATSYIYNTKLRFTSGVYTFSSTNSESVYRYLIKAYDASGNILTTANLISGWTFNSYYNGYFTGVNNVKAAIPETVAYWQVGFVFAGVAVGTRETYSNIQIEQGTVATPYEPFPAPKTLNAKLGSKNLINNAKWDGASPFTTNGVTFTANDDGSVTANGTATGGLASYYNRTLLKSAANKTFTISGITGGSSTTYRIRVSRIGKAYTDLYDGYKTFTPDGNIEMVILSISEGVTVNNLVFKPQLELSTTATSYTPHISDFSTVNVTRCGKNILEYPYVETTLTRNGLTFTDNKDGTITVNGTAKADTQFRLQDTVAYPNNPNPFNSLIGKKVYINGSPEGSSKDTYAIQWVAAGTYGNGVMTVTKSSYYRFAIFVKSGITVENLVFKPQIELGITAIPYEPYQGQTYTPTATGEVTGITNLYPTTTLLTNNAGVVFTKVLQGTQGSELIEILPSTGKNGIIKINQPIIDSSVDDNIKPENIKKGVKILGILGTYDEGLTMQEALDAQATEIALSGGE